MLARHLLRFGVAAAVIVALTGAEGLDPGELHCEEAVHHLTDCCHQTYSYTCTAGRGCDEGRPQLDDPLASQIKDTSCEQLIAQGTCQQPPVSEPYYPDLSVIDLAHPDLSHPDLSRPADLSSDDGGDM